MFLEVGNLNGIIELLFLIMFGPAILFLIIGGILFAIQKKKAGKVLFILAGIYLLISIGVCGVVLLRA